MAFPFLLPNEPHCLVRISIHAKSQLHDGFKREAVREKKGRGHTLAGCGTLNTPPPPTAKALVYLVFVTLESRHLYSMVRFIYIFLP